MKKYYSVIVDDSELIELLVEQHRLTMVTPKKKSMFESVEKYTNNVEKLNKKKDDLIDKIVIKYKNLYPDLYEHFDLYNFGFTSGRHKTYFLYISKRERDEIN